jgi:ribonucleoside-diphosphate reductase alpha chain
MTTIYENLSIERKQLQVEGQNPDWLITAGWQLFKEKYLYDARGFRDTYIRIARTLARHTDNPREWEERFFTVLWKGWLAGSTPVLSNTGTIKGCPVSCSGQYVEDSVKGFYESRLETALLTKNGFGTSAYLGAIRSRGEGISGGGKASGVLPVLKGFVNDMRDVCQGNSRRGAWAGYLPIMHDDFDEISDHLLAFPDDCNIGWNISDAFIYALEQGEPEAIRRYKKSLKVKAVTGKGYYFFTDKVNRANPSFYAEKGLEVHASNLCVAGETEILTSEGYLPIRDLVGTQVSVWNGEEFSDVEVKKTGTNQKLIKVTTDWGQVLECTEQHKFYVMKLPNTKNVSHQPHKKHMKRAKDLKMGDKLIRFDLPLIHGTKEITQPYENGFYTGDGCCNERHGRVYLYGERHKWEENTGPEEDVCLPKYNKDTAHEMGLKEKFFVPDSTYTVDTRLKWLAGFCDAEGVVIRQPGSEVLQVGSINKHFLKEIQFMLHTLGVHSKLVKFREAGTRLLPLNNGSFNMKVFDSQTIYKLHLYAKGVHDLTIMGFSCQRLTWTHKEAHIGSINYTQIAKVEDEGRYGDTYCFTEPKRSMGMFGGILTGQCTEITLYANEEETFTCVLSSLNVSKYDEWKNTDAVFTSTVFLDCVASEFIELGKEKGGLDKSVLFTEKNRALGLGTLGFHTYLQQNMIDMESLEAHTKNIEIFSHIKKQALEASKWMAREWGEPEHLIGTGRRNSHLLSVAPNTSSALICGGVSQGIEAVVANVYNQATAGGEMYRVNPVFLKLAKDRVGWSDELVKSITDNNGSIQHLPWLTEHEKGVFKTAYEIDQHVLVRLAAARQPFICQAQSLNLFFDADEKEEVISSVHKEAFLNEQIKSLYYLRTKAGVQASSGECLACE